MVNLLEEIKKLEKRIEELEEIISKKDKSVWVRFISRITLVWYLELF